MKKVIYLLFAVLFLAFSLQSCQEKTNNSIVEANSGYKSKQVVSRAIIDHIYKGGDTNAFKGTAKEQSSIHAINEKASYNSYQFDFIFDDGAMAKGGNLGQFIYVDPKRDFVGVVFSNHPYHSGYGEFKAPAFIRHAAKVIA